MLNNEPGANKTLCQIELRGKHTWGSLAAQGNGSVMIFVVILHLFQ